MYPFSDQKIVVTGGTRGLGAAMTRAFIDAGGEVWATYVRDCAAAEAFRSGLAVPERCHLAQFDVADEREAEGFFDSIPGPPQVVVNNAGIRKDNILGMMTQEDWDAVIRTNLTGTFVMSKQAVRRMSRAKYGRIVNIVSPMSRLGFAGQANYAASKAGQVAMARSLAKEVASRKITVNSVSPGFVDTELLADLSDEQQASYRELIPMRRFGTPEEVAHAVLFVASQAASYVTGTVLEVAGGV